MDTRDIQPDPAAPAVEVDFPAGRTRFNTQQVLKLIGMPAGSKVAFQDLVIETRVDSEVIGTSRVYTREAVLVLAEALRRRRAARQGAPAPKKPGRRGRSRGRSTTYA